MGNKIYYSDKASSDTLVSLTASSQIAGYEKTYILDNSPGTIWKSNGITNQYLLFDFGFPIYIAGVCWSNMNIDSGDTTFNIKGGNALPVVTASQDLTKNYAGAQDLGWTYRYFQMNMTKASGTFIQAGKIGLYELMYEFEKPYIIGGRSGYQTFFEGQTSKYGQNQRKELYTNFQENVTFKYITTNQKDKFERIREKTHIHYLNEWGNVYFCVTEIGLPAFTIDNTQGTRWDISMGFTEVK